MHIWKCPHFRCRMAAPSVTRRDVSLVVATFPPCFPHVMNADCFSCCWFLLILSRCLHYHCGCCFRLCRLNCDNDLSQTLRPSPSHSNGPLNVIVFFEYLNPVPVHSENSSMIYLPVWGMLSSQTNMSDSLIRLLFPLWALTSIPIEFWAESQEAPVFCC